VSFSSMAQPEISQLIERVAGARDLTLLVHELEDGFIVAWDSSDFDDELRRKLIEVCDRRIGRIVVDMTGTAQPRPDQKSRIV
jgi:hypothetical protein